MYWIYCLNWREQKVYHYYCIDFYQSSPSKWKKALECKTLGAYRDDANNTRTNIGHASRCSCTPWSVLAATWASCIGNYAQFEARLDPLPFLPEPPESTISLSPAEPRHLNPRYCYARGRRRGSARLDIAHVSPRVHALRINRMNTHVQR